MVDKVPNIAERHARFSKRIAFFIILKPFLHVGSKVFISTGFISVSATQFWFLRPIRLSDMTECHLGFIYKRNDYRLLSRPFAILAQNTPLLRAASSKKGIPEAIP